LNPPSTLSYLIVVQDASIAYRDTRYPSEEIKPGASGRQKILGMNPQGTFPVVELDGKILTQSYAILRHFARLLGEYDGGNGDEMYWVDAMCDVAIDWRTKFVDAFFCAPEERRVKYAFDSINSSSA
jgi:glutathione S-transferase